MSEYIGYKTPMFGQKLANGEDALVTVLTSEEVIRCRDCRKFETVDCAVYRALRADSRIDSKGMFNPNGFCAWAERRKA